MSRLKYALLAGSVLIATSFSGAAYAFDECTPANPPVTQTDGVDGVSDPTLNGAVADNFNCTAAAYASGITYASSGNLTVTKTNTGVTNVGATGVNLSATGSDSVSWDSTVGGVTGTGGPTIDVSSVSGAIVINTAAVTASAAGATHGIRATSTGGGAITIFRATGGVNNNVAGGEAAIQAVTNGGNIAITTATGFTQGRARGILAQTSGAGSVTLTLNGTVNASTIDGVAAVDVTTGTGGLTLTQTSGSLNGGTGLAVRAVSTGAASVNITGGGIGSISSGQPTPGGAVDFSGVANGVTFTTSGAGTWGASGASVFTGAADTLSFTGTGTSVLGVGASIDFGGGANLLNVSGVFKAGAGSEITFGSGADRLNTSGFLSLGEGAEITFGAGTDTVNASGVMSVESAAMTGVEAFNNSGTIYFGPGMTMETFPAIDWTKSDGDPDDVFALSGVTYTGSGSARLVMDAVLDGSAQTGCGAPSGAADCFDLRNSSTAGVTLVTVNNLAPAATLSAYNPDGVTLVDVSGSGTSGAGHFVLDPNTAGYADDPVYGGVIVRPGLFRYALRYDPATQRHALVGLPRGEAMEYAILSGAAQSIWQMTSDAVTDRQALLRKGVEGGSAWVRVTGDYVKRDTATSFEHFGETFTFDNSYRLYAGSIMGGGDFITGQRGDYEYVVGGQIGYVGSSFELDASDSTGRFTGGTGGVYASLWSDVFFLDGTINANVLTLDYDSAGTGTKTNTYLNSIGAQAESGLRVMLSERAFVEPLVNVSYVRTRFEEISLDGGEVKPADAASLRGALGLRLGAELPGQAVNVSYFVAGRAWNEFDGESGGVIKNPGVDLTYADDLGGAYGEAELGVNLFNTAGTLAGYVTSGVKFKDGYSATNLSAGVRMAW